MTRRTNRTVNFADKANPATTLYEQIAVHTVLRRRLLTSLHNLGQCQVAAEVASRALAVEFTVNDLHDVVREVIAGQAVAEIKERLCKKKTLSIN
jgi:hypothetical protein